MVRLQFFATTRTPSHAFEVFRLLSLFLSNNSCFGCDSYGRAYAGFRTGSSCAGCSRTTEGGLFGEADDASAEARLHWRDGLWRAGCSFAWNSSTEYVGWAIWNAFELRVSVDYVCGRNQHGGFVGSGAGCTDRSRDRP